MRWFKRLLSAIWSGFKFSRAGLACLDQIQRDASTILSRHWPTLQMIARLTPTRTDDEILTAAEALGVAIRYEPGMSAADALREIARLAIRRREPDASDSIINLAIEAGVAALKAEGARHD